MSLPSALLMLASDFLTPMSSSPLPVQDYGWLHYYYAGAVGEQGCAEHRANGPLKRRFVTHYDPQVKQVDAWFAKRFSAQAHSDALAGAYGNPHLIDVRDCLVSNDGEPMFRDTSSFVRLLGRIQRAMKKEP